MERRIDRHRIEIVSYERMCGSGCRLEVHFDDIAPEGDSLRQKSEMRTILQPETLRRFIGLLGCQDGFPLFGPPFGAVLGRAILDRLAAARNRMNGPVVIA